MINSGKGYDNATSALERIEKDVLAHRPTIVTISFGLNDTGGRKPDEFKQSLAKMVKTFKAADIQVILITSTPFDNDRHGWGESETYQALGGLDQYMDRAFCQKMRELAEEEELVLCDLHAAFRGAIAKDPEMMKRAISGDGVHLTEFGVTFAAKHITPDIIQLAKGRKKKSSVNP